MKLENLELPIRPFQLDFYAVLLLLRTVETILGKEARSTVQNVPAVINFDTPPVRCYVQ